MSPQHVKVIQVTLVAMVTIVTPGAMVYLYTPAMV